MAYPTYRREDMEAEMNRFEQEISTNGQMPMNHLKPSGPPMHFIPHQLQRQQPRSFVPPANRPYMVVPQAAYQPIPQAYASTVAAPNMSMYSVVQPPPPPPPQASSTQANYTVTPMGLPSSVHTVPGSSSTSGTASSTNDSKKVKTKVADKGKKQKKFLRQAGGTTWEDTTLQEWESDDFRIFCGDLGNDVNNEILSRAFNKYSSFLKAKVVRDKRTNKTKGYGFVSFKDPNDFIRAMREMNGKYVGSRPIKLRKSCWKDRSLEMVKKKTKEKQRLGLI